jgi:hypothetical protein
MHNMYLVLDLCSCQVMHAALCLGRSCTLLGQALRTDWPASAYAQAQRSCAAGVSHHVLLQAFSLVRAFAWHPP